MAVQNDVVQAKLSVISGADASLMSFAKANADTQAAAYNSYLQAYRNHPVSGHEGTAHPSMWSAGVVGRKVYHVPLHSHPDTRHDGHPPQTTHPPHSPILAASHPHPLTHGSIPTLATTHTPTPPTHDGQHMSALQLASHAGTKTVVNHMAGTMNNTGQHMSAPQLAFNAGTKTVVNPVSGTGQHLSQHHSMESLVDAFLADAACRAAAVHEDAAGAWEVQMERRQGEGQAAGRPQMRPASPQQPHMMIGKGGMIARGGMSPRSVPMQASPKSKTNTRASGVQQLQRGSWTSFSVPLNASSASKSKPISTLNPLPSSLSPKTPVSLHASNTPPASSAAHATSSSSNPRPSTPTRGTKPTNKDTSSAGSPLRRPSSPQASGSIHRFYRSKVNSILTTMQTLPKAPPQLILSSKRANKPPKEDSTHTPPVTHRPQSPLWALSPYGMASQRKPQPPATQPGSQNGTPASPSRPNRPHSGPGRLSSSPVKPANKPGTTLPYEVSDKRGTVQPRPKSAPAAAADGGDAPGMLAFGVEQEHCSLALSPTRRHSTGSTGRPLTPFTTGRGQAPAVANGPAGASSSVTSRTPPGMPNASKLCSPPSRSNSISSSTSAASGQAARASPHGRFKFVSKKVESKRDKDKVEASASKPNLVSRRHSAPEVAAPGRKLHSDANSHHSHIGSTPSTRPQSTSICARAGGAARSPKSPNVASRGSLASRPRSPNLLGKRKVGTPVTEGVTNLPLTRPNTAPGNLTPSLTDTTATQQTPTSTSGPNKVLNTHIKVLAKDLAREKVRDKMAWVDSSTGQQSEIGAVAGEVAQTRPALDTLESEINAWLTEPPPILHADSLPLPAPSWLPAAHITSGLIAAQHASGIWDSDPDVQRIDDSDDDEEEEDVEDYTIHNLHPAAASLNTPSMLTGFHHMRPQNTDANCVGAHIKAHDTPCDPVHVGSTSEITPHVWSQIYGLQVEHADPAVRSALQTLHRQGPKASMLDNSHSSTTKHTTPVEQVQQPPAMVHALPARVMGNSSPAGTNHLEQVVKQMIDDEDRVGNCKNVAGHSIGTASGTRSSDDGLGCVPRHVPQQTSCTAAVTAVLSSVHEVGVRCGAKADVGTLVAGHMVSERGMSGLPAGHIVSEKGTSFTDLACQPGGLGSCAEAEGLTPTSLTSSGRVPSLTRAVADVYRQEDLRVQAARTASHTTSQELSPTLSLSKSNDRTNQAAGAAVPNPLCSSTGPAGTSLSDSVSGAVATGVTQLGSTAVQLGKNATTHPNMSVHVVPIKASSARITDQKHAEGKANPIVSGSGHTDERLCSACAVIGSSAPVSSVLGVGVHGQGDQVAADLTSTLTTTHTSASNPLATDAAAAAATRSIHNPITTNMASVCDSNVGMKQMLDGDHDTASDDVSESSSYGRGTNVLHDGSTGDEGDSTGLGAMSSPQLGRHHEDWIGKNVELVGEIGGADAMLQAEQILSKKSSSLQGQLNVANKVSDTLDMEECRDDHSPTLDTVSKLQRSSPAMKGLLNGGRHSASLATEKDAVRAREDDRTTVKQQVTHLLSHADKLARSSHQAQSVSSFGDHILHDTSTIVMNAGVAHMFNSNSGHALDALAKAKLGDTRGTSLQLIQGEPACSDDTTSSKQQRDQGRSLKTKPVSPPKSGMDSSAAAHSKQGTQVTVQEQDVHRARAGQSESKLRKLARKPGAKRCISIGAHMSGDVSKSALDTDVAVRLQHLTVHKSSTHDESATTQPSSSSTSRSQECVPSGTSSVLSGAREDRPVISKADADVAMTGADVDVSGPDGGHVFEQLWRQGSELLDWLEVDGVWIEETLVPLAEQELQQQIQLDMME